MKILLSILIGVTVLFSEATPARTESEDISNEIKVTLLGTGGGPGGGGANLIAKKMNASTLVEAGGRRFLFDVGRGAFIRLASLGSQYVMTTDKVFLTHLHSDHIIDLSDLFLSGSGRGFRTKLFVWGPKGTESMTDNLVKAYNWDLKYRSNPIRPRLMMVGNDIREGIVYTKDDVTVTAFDVDHWPPRKNEKNRAEFPALGYRLDYKGRSLVISGDTRPTENLVKFSNGVDLLIHEVHVGLNRNKRYNLRRPLRGGHHTSPSEAGELFHKIKPNLAVYSHIIWGRRTQRDLINLTREKYQGPLVIGQEMMQFKIGDKVQVMPAN